MRVAWIEVFTVFALCHLAGDFLLQTNDQALDKNGGLHRGRRRARHALLSHVALYTVAFAPALVWLADDLSPLAVAATAAGVFLPHLVVDDGAVVTWWMHRVKGTVSEPGEPLYLYVDQTLHVLSLFALALAVAS